MTIFLLSPSTDKDIISAPGVHVHLVERCKTARPLSLLLRVSLSRRCAEALGGHPKHTLLEAS